MDNYSVVAENIKAGKLRPLAVGSRARLKWLPDVPTVAESGYPDYEVSVWYGLLAPSGTPVPWSINFRTALRPQCSLPLSNLRGTRRVSNLSAIPRLSLLLILRQQQEQYGRVIREANIQPS